MLSIASEPPSPARIRNHCSLSASRGDFALPAAASVAGSASRKRLNRRLVMTDLLAFLASGLDRDFGARRDVGVVDDSVQLPVVADTTPDMQVLSVLDVGAATNVADTIAALLDAQIAAHERQLRVGVVRDLGSRPVVEVGLDFLTSANRRPMLRQDLRIVGEERGAGREIVAGDGLLEGACDVGG